MARKKYISSNLIKIISYVFMFLILAVTLTVMTSKIMSRLMQKSEREYFEGYKTVLSGYTKAVSVTLKSYENVLDVFNYEPVMSKASDKEIANYLLSCQNKKPSDIISLMYVNTEGNGYTSYGPEISVKGNHFYFNDEHKPVRYYIGDGIADHARKYPPCFTVSEPVYDEKGNLKGTLCAMIPIYVLRNIFEKDAYSSDVQVSIQDGKRCFIYARDSEMLMKSPEINPEDYEEYENIFKSVKDNDYFTFTGKMLNGNEFDFLVAAIPDTEWIITVCVPLELRKAFVHQQKMMRIQIIAGLFILAALLFALDIHVNKMLQRRQLLETINDPLTGVFARQHFEILANKMLRRHPFTNFMVVECDIRGFKFINQKYGEKTADELLAFLGQILHDETDEHKGIIGRGYADHFTMLFRIGSVEHALEQFEKEMEVIAEKLKASDISFFPAFGIAFHLGADKDILETQSIQNLIGQANFAKNSNKNNLVKNYAVYDSKLVEKVQEELFYEENMESALEKDEFFVMYQPKINLNSEKIQGAEALVRWNSPKLGFVGPDKFIPIFEKNGFITKLDFFVYEEVFKFQQHCIDAGLPTVKISLNMSRKHPDPAKFMKDFLKLFHKYTIPPQLIEIEILERSVMGSIDLSEIVDMLHKEGFSVAMDDFGSGESSLNMLTKIPVDVLKFDRAFLLGSDGNNKKLDESTKNFIRTLVNLGKNLNKQTVFEGVETEEQKDFLKSINCDMVQGFYFSRPLFIADFINFIQKRS